MRNGNVPKANANVFSMAAFAGAVLFGLVSAPGAWADEKGSDFPIAWNQWGGGQWKSHACSVQAATNTLTITYVVGDRPDVWPGAWTAFPSPLDLGRYAQFEFEVRVSTPHDRLPARALSGLLRNSWGAQWQFDEMPSPPRPGEWTKQRVEIASLPLPLMTNLNHFQFFVWNRDYHNAGFQKGEKVVFEVRNARLAGLRPPTLAARFGASPLQHLLATNSLAFIWSEPPDTKVLPEQTVPEHVASERGVVLLEAAANEYVDFQVAVRATAGLREVTVQVESPGFAPRSAARFSAADLLVRPVGLVKTTKASGRWIRPGRCPDPLLNPGPLDIAAGETRSFWVRLHVPAETPRGLYQGAITIAAATGEVARARYQLKVYGFALPKVSHLKTAFQLYTDRNWSRFQDYYPNPDFHVFEKFWRNLAQHRLSPMHIGPKGPPRPANEQSLVEFDRYVDLAWELGFNNLLSFHWGPPVNTDADRTWIQQMTDYYRRKELLDRTYVYMCQFDEAQSNRWPEIQRYASDLKQTEPRLRRMLTVAPAAGLYGSIDVWCPGIPNYDRQLARERRKLGEQVWWYSAVQWVPGLLIDYPGSMHRSLTWLSWTHEVDGYLFWCINYWQKNPWEESQQGAGTAGNGDGYLIYPRRTNDPADHFYETVRWEILRDAMEDYEYFWLLRERLGTAERSGKRPARVMEKARAALAAIEKVAPNINNFSLVPEDYAWARRLMAEAIEELEPSLANVP